MQDEKNKGRDTAEEHMPICWHRMHREGVEFFVDGEPVISTDELVRVVREDGVYMADYVWGEKGKIKQVRLDKVTPE